MRNLLRTSNYIKEQYHSSAVYARIRGVALYRHHRQNHSHFLSQTDVKVCKTLLHFMRRNRSQLYEENLSVVRAGVDRTRAWSPEYSSMGRLSPPEQSLLSPERAVDHFSTFVCFPRCAKKKDIISLAKEFFSLWVILAINGR